MRRQHPLQTLAKGPRETGISIRKIGSVAIRHYMTSIDRIELRNTDTPLKTRFRRNSAGITPAELFMRVWGDRKIPQQQIS